MAARGRMYNTAVVKIPRPSVGTVILAVLLVSLVVSGVMIVRLIDRLSEKELQERREALQSGMLGFRAALAGHLFKAISESHPGPPSFFFSAALREDLADEFIRNSKRGGESQLVSGLAIGSTTESGEIRFERFDLAKERYVSAPWPEEMSALRAALEPEKAGVKPATDRRPGFAFLLSGQHPMIALPLVYREPGRWDPERRTAFLGFRRGSGGRRDPEGRPDPPEGRDAERRDPGRESGPGRPELWRQWEPSGRGFRGFPLDIPSGMPRPPSSQNGFGFPLGPGPERPGPRMLGWCFLILDFEKMKTEILPQLLARHFRGREREFGLAIISPPDGESIVRAGAPVPMGDDTRVDAALSLVERRGIPFDMRGTGPGSPPAEVDESVMLRQVLADPSNGWILVARHQRGSLEAVVGANRNRSVALALSLLGLLGSSGTLLVWSSRRSRELARRQMEFVAGVSHELLTPVSVIRTAATNLSRGLINDRQKALEYGNTLEKESKRLSKMIEQVLSFAALQSGTAARTCEPVDVSQLLREVMSEYRPWLEQKGWEVCEEIEAVGQARIDRRALESCLCNLIDNAAKYAQSGQWLRVTASRCRVKSKPVVRVTVEDRGPGIAGEDLRHIFKPFYRGRGLAASNVPGAGLGLSIVRRHLRARGGDVLVVSSLHGCVFSVVLPPAD